MPKIVGKPSEARGEAESSFSLPAIEGPKPAGTWVLDSSHPGL